MSSQQSQEVMLSIEDTLPREILDDIIIKAIKDISVSPKKIADVSPLFSEIVKSDWVAHETSKVGFFYLEQTNTGGSFINIYKDKLPDNVERYNIICCVKYPESRFSIEQIEIFLNEYFDDNENVYFDGDGDCPCCGPRWSGFTYQCPKSRYDFIPPYGYPCDLSESIIYEFDFSGISNLKSFNPPFPEPIYEKKDMIQKLNFVDSYKKLLKDYVNDEYFEEEDNMLDEYDRILLDEI